MVADRRRLKCVDGMGIDDMHFDDACIAVGVAVLDLFADGESEVLVTPDGEGGWKVRGIPEDEEPSEELEGWWGE